MRSRRRAASGDGTSRKTTVGEAVGPNKKDEEQSGKRQPRSTATPHRRHRRPCCRRCGSLGAWELGPQQALLWEGRSRCDVTAGSRSQPRIHGSFSVSACCGWLKDSRDGVMQRDEALLFALGVAQTVGRGKAASPIQPHTASPCPCPGGCSSQRAGFTTSPDEMGFSYKRALTFGVEQ